MPKRTYFRAVVRQEVGFGASCIESQWFPTWEQAQKERKRLYARASRRKKKHDTDEVLTTRIVQREFDARTEEMWAAQGFLIKA